MGDGRNTLFWQGRWILGQRLEDVAPLIHSMVPKRIANKRTLYEALKGMTWARDIHGVASAKFIMEILYLCNVIPDVMLPSML